MGIDGAVNLSKCSALLANWCSLELPHCYRYWVYIVLNTVSLQAIHTHISFFVYSNAHIGSTFARGSVLTCHFLKSLLHLEFTQILPTMVLHTLVLPASQVLVWRLTSGAEKHKEVILNTYHIA